MIKYKLFLEIKFVYFINNLAKDRNPFFNKFTIIHSDTTSTNSTISLNFFTTIWAIFSVRLYQLLTMFASIGESQIKYTDKKDYQTNQSNIRTRRYLIIAIKQIQSNYNPINHKCNYSYCCQPSRNLFHLITAFVRFNFPYLLSSYHITNLHQILFSYCPHNKFMLKALLHIRFRLLFYKTSHRKN